MMSGVTHEPPAMRVVGALVALLLTGCASLDPAQERSLGEVRAFADRTAVLYGLAPIHVLVSRNPDSPIGSYRRGFFAVNLLALGSEFRDAIVAHELAHYVLGHDAPPRGPTLEARAREREQRELDANAKSVEILARVKEIPEARALEAVYDYLLRVSSGMQKSPPVGIENSPPPPP